MIAFTLTDVAAEKLASVVLGAVDLLKDSEMDNLFIQLEKQGVIPAYNLTTAGVLVRR